MVRRLIEHIWEEDVVAYLNVLSRTRLERHENPYYSFRFPARFEIGAFRIKVRGVTA
jgi:hypothetical protein